MHISSWKSKAEKWGKASSGQEDDRFFRKPNSKKDRIVVDLKNFLSRRFANSKKAPDIRVQVGSHSSADNEDRELAKKLNVWLRKFLLHSVNDRVMDRKFADIHDFSIKPERKHVAIDSQFRFPRNFVGRCPGSAAFLI
ncbi:unnamed protein product [Notodromas monacha]|uniref:Uncharacterized protein n=1 Tax=Notodromas monacha TaxID=399045 RepID=A0A7R9GH28_9CRUS|nr:unnamed protein product [Notodromas monacha]CAD7283546.1 unnamed protein product [Notodromas monacha]CAG0920864.1 unnamed protein product [Notodromas monacha]CAG0923698.1 unnamed protein product [Notodromas monacha]